MKQAALDLNLSVNKTRKREFLEQIGARRSWTGLFALIAPYYPEGHTGRPPLTLETMLRTHFLQQWFSLSDPAMEEACFGKRRELDKAKQPQSMRSSTKSRSSRPISAPRSNTLFAWLSASLVT